MPLDALTKIKNKIKEGEIVIGSHVTFNESCITEIFGDIGFDFVWIDKEHSPLDRQETLLHIMAARSAGTAAFVRIPWNDPVLAKPILEMGPQGIVFPFIKTAEEAETAVKSCTYPPAGIRGYGPRRADKYGLVDNREYIRNACSSVWKIIQIEHIEGVRNLGKILDVTGIDAIVVGPNDLSASMGLIGQTNHKKVKEAMDEIAKNVTDSGIPLGVSMGYESWDVVEEWLERGVNWIGIGIDFGFVVKTGLEVLNGTKKIAREHKRRQ